jgi:hypothetical protein
LQTEIAEIFLEYNLLEPEYNMHEQKYNMHEPEYNLHAPEYNRHEPKYNLHEPLNLLFSQKGLSQGPDISHVALIF